MNTQTRTIYRVPSTSTMCEFRSHFECDLYTAVKAAVDVARAYNAFVVLNHANVPVVIYRRDTVARAIGQWERNRDY